MDDARPVRIDLRAACGDLGVRKVLDELDRDLVGLARLRQANRLVSRDRPVTADDLCIISGPDIRAGRVFHGGLGPDGSPRKDRPDEF
ncbi:hypothetical protein [Paracoccus luteus]|uniref:hypothetical protein n=1 Tax=Paracoccus luteus TaxID=2508543 RepID=UPI0010705908|nr:hypothetical protein [Paracoccus luteus]